MSSREIVLVTACGEGYGSGHYRRQLTLLQWLRRYTDCSVRMFFANGSPPADMPPKFAAALIDRLPRRAALVVRDMRDSAPGDIEALAATGPVCVVDDAGAGRHSAARAVDLLPNRYGCPPPADSPFLYGYNFINGLELSARQPAGAPERVFDLLVYAAPGGGLESADQVQQCLPPGWKVCVAGGARPLVLEAGTTCATDMNYVELLRSSSMVLSHFGIMLFEARLAGCRLLALNPGQYHSSLCDAAQSILQCVNLGTVRDMDVDALRAALLRERPLAPATMAGAVFMLERAEKQIARAAELVTGGFID